MKTALIAILAAASLVAASPAGATDKQVRATFKTTVLQFNRFWNTPSGTDYLANQIADETEATKLTVAMATLRAEGAKGVGVKVGKQLALQALADMKAGILARAQFDADFESAGENVSDPSVIGDLVTAAKAMKDGRPLLRAAATALQVRVPIYPFPKP